jgi:integration host factor subunit alpha
MPSASKDQPDLSLLSLELDAAEHVHDLLTVTKADLAQSLHDALRMPKVEALQVIDAFFDTLQKALGRGEEVKLMNFGSFELREKQARPGRNPQTGEPVTITSRRVVTFHATPKLKQRLQAASSPKPKLTAKAEAETEMPPKKQKASQQSQSHSL